MYFPPLVVSFVILVMAVINKRNKNNVERAKDFSLGITVTVFGGTLVLGLTWWLHNGMD